MPKKGMTKGKISATIDKVLLEKLNEYCEKKGGLKHSTVLEDALKEFLERRKP